MRMFMFIVTILVVWCYLYSLHNKIESEKLRKKQILALM
jgi:hypothetical protein